MHKVAARNSVPRKRSCTLVLLTIISFEFNHIVTHMHRIICLSKKRTISSATIIICTSWLHQVWNISSSIALSSCRNIREITNGKHFLSHSLFHDLQAFRHSTSSVWRVAMNTGLMDQTLASIGTTRLLSHRNTMHGNWERSLYYLCQQMHMAWLNQAGRGKCTSNCFLCTISHGTKLRMWKETFADAHF